MPLQALNVVEEAMSDELHSKLADRRGDPVAIFSEHNDQMVWGDLGDGVQCVRQHAAPAEGV